MSQVLFVQICQSICNLSENCEHLLLLDALLPHRHANVIVKAAAIAKLLFQSNLIRLFVELTVNRSDDLLQRLLIIQPYGWLVEDDNVLVLQLRINICLALDQLPTCVAAVLRNLQCNELTALDIKGFVDHAKSTFANNA